MSTITRGTIVDYQGSISYERDVIHVVTAVDDLGRLTLANRDYPTFTLRLVRPTSVEPTGEVTQLCDCGHEYHWTQRDNDVACSVYGCVCLSHARKAKDAQVGHIVDAGPWVAGTQLGVQRGYVTQATDENYPTMVRVWFPELGAPGPGVSEGMIFLHEIERVRLLSEMPKKWVRDIHKQLRDDEHQGWLHWHPAVARPLDEAVSELRRAERERRAARRTEPPVLVAS